MKPSRHANRLRNGLLGYWRLNEQSGSALSHNSALDLTDNNTVTQALGIRRLPFARQFTAANLEYFSKASVADLQVGGIFTACAWVYLDSTPGALRAIVGKYLTTGNQREWVMAINATSQLQMTVSANGTAITSLASTATVATGTWYFVQCGYSGNYLWSRINKSQMELSAFSSGVFSGTADLMLGAYNGGTAFWDGRIASVGIWKRTLSISEMDWLYNNANARYVI